MTHPNVAGFLALYGAYVAGLHIFDGPWTEWKKDGPKTLDTWTLTHIAWGAIAERFGISLEGTTFLAALNEAGEFAVREARPDLLFGSPETPANVAADIATTALGWGLSRMFR